MNDRLENRIRDYLTQHLDLLEPDLKLIKPEYELPNVIGAGGRIDILARDRFGNYLVIEIRRSDQAARQALNEMFKYTGLFRRNQGLDETKVRLFVVSTHWHELLLPLSEYAEAVGYAVQGFQIVALSDGTVTSASQVSLVPPVEALHLSRIQGVYLAQKRDENNQRAIALSAAAKRIGIQDFVILSCEHDSSNPPVAFGHALWFCFSSPFRMMSKPEIAKLKNSIEWDDDLDEPEENFLCALNQDSEAYCDTLEIGYPEKLTNLERSWKISVLVREGRLSSNASLLTDEEIMRLAKKVEGGSQVYFGKICSPHLKAAWKQMLVDLRLPLKGNRLWEKTVPVFLKKVASESPQATVSVSLYNPCNLLLSLYHVGSCSDYSRCAYLEICVEDRVGKQFTVLASSLAWNGKPVSIAPEALVENVYGFFEMSCANGAEYEDRAMSAHNLSTPIVAFRFQDQIEPAVCGVKLDGGKLTFTPLATESFPTLEGFETANQAYLKSLKAYLESNLVGLLGSNASASNESPQ
ncbi:MAG: endonuclease NucS domain-containing protein [Limisphaerales bacterium]